MTKSRKKTLWFIIGSVLLIVIVVLAVKKGKSDDARKVAVEKVIRRNIIETVSANGKIQPAKDVKISPYISGEVVALYVKEGNFVKKGQKLAKIDPKIYISSFQQAEAALKTTEANQASSKARLAQSQAQYTKSRLDFARSQKLWKNQVISDADFDAARSAYLVAKAEVKAAEESYKASQFQVKSSKAKLSEAEENLNRTSIYAPNDGTVSKLSVQVGERVTGASQFSAGTEIMRVANLDVMEVNVEVNENDIVQVAMDDTALIEVDAYLNRKFKGIITEIATSANTTGVSADQVTNFDVKILMLKSSYADLIQPKKPIPSPFRPGMSATVEIQTKRADHVLAVPIQAVTTRADTTGRVKSALEKREEKKTHKRKTGELQKKIQDYVFLYQNGTARLQKVKTGIQDNMYIEINKGVKEGQEVITAPYRLVSKTLKNNDKVKKVDKKELFTSKKK
ncbi:MAG TPA: HlyD family efflux transporter periplasmic adaptor subunit [Bacteroidetes bacterium]|nr:HlyD family efflux transporter periplasmic adaptor subunit [Bacteroidota bacterium]